MNTTHRLARYTIYAVIAIVVFLLLRQWATFSKDYEESLELQKQPLSTFQDVENNFENITSEFEQSSAANDIDVPVVNHASSADTIDNQIANFEPEHTSNLSRKITITTDTIRVSIDKLGGDIVELAMIKHLTSLEQDAEPLKLLEQKDRTYIAQSGLIGESGSNNKSARAFFSSIQNNYQMKEGQTLFVKLFFKDPEGVLLTKTFTFKPNSYLINVSYQVQNNSKQNWQATFYSKISRDSSEDPGVDTSGFGMRSYLGAATTTEDDPYKKIDFDDIEEKTFRNTYTGGWIAMIQHYFVSAWIPNQQQSHHYYTKKSKNGLNIIGFYSDPLHVSPGETGNVSAQFYAGPKNQYKLADIAKHLDLTVDYGWLWWLSQPLYALLNMFATGELNIFGESYKVFPGFHNWGVAIILLTVVVKLIFFKLSAASYRSMANMRRVQPKLLALRERHANDKQAQSKAMMELYQKEKINPLGGCLPILIQMPVFIALYWALIESVELRHAPFMLWLNDLSVMDPYFVLPIIMGVTMFLQQKMNPAPPDPMQAKIMSMMPIVFTFFFLWFPAGLVIYWVSNNMLSILQQWVITRSINKEN